MTEVIAVTIVVIGILTFIMYTLLKQVVNRISEQSKLYYSLKLQSYDELIEKKEKRIKELNDLENKEHEIDNSKDEEKSVDVVVPKDNPEFKINDLMQVVKMVETDFDLDNKKVIENFINNYYKVTMNEYLDLKKIKQYINDYGIYNVKTSMKDMNEVFEDLKIADYPFIKDYVANHRKIDIDELLIELDMALNKFDPTIYVGVKDKKENYDSINKNIKTYVDDSILKGVKIRYRGVLYDYSLS